MTSGRLTCMLADKKSIQPFWYYSGVPPISQYGRTARRDFTHEFILFTVFVC